MSLVARTGSAERVLMREAHRVGYGVHGVEEVGDAPSLRFLRGNLLEFGTALRFYVEIMGARPLAAVIDKKWSRNDGLKASQFLAAADSAYEAFMSTNGKSAKAVVAAWRRILPRPRPTDSGCPPVLMITPAKPKASGRSREL